MRKSVGQKNLTGKYRKLGGGDTLAERRSQGDQGEVSFTASQKAQSSRPLMPERRKGGNDMGATDFLFRKGKRNARSDQHIYGWRKTKKFKESEGKAGSRAVYSQKKLLTVEKR